MLRKLLFRYVGNLDTWATIFSILCLFYSINQMDRGAHCLEYLLRQYLNNLMNTKCLLLVCLLV